MNTYLTDSIDKESRAGLALVPLNQGLSKVFHHGMGQACSHHMFKGACASNLIHMAVGSCQVLPGY